MDNAALLSNLYNMQTQYSLNTTSLDLEIPRCVINSNSRAITIPEEIKFFGVQYDHRSTSVFFEIDRIVDDVDLSTQTCIVQWINGDLTTGNMGFFPVTNVDTSIPDKLVFEWEIYNESTQLTGDLHFSIRFYSMMDEKTFLYSYNTLPARSIILDTLDVQMTSTIEIKPSALEIWTERVSQLEIVARESIEISKKSAAEAEAWAHGRNDHPNTILDNALYYKNLTAAIYQEAKGSVEIEKEVVVAEIADAKNQSISEIQAITDNSVRTAQQTGEEIEQNVLQYGVVQVSEMPPESDHVQVWIQPNQSEEYSLPEIKDDEINEVDTWSSHKIKTELDKNDITQLKSDLNDLSNTKSGAIVQTASGKSVVVNDSSDDPLRGLRVFGKTEQFTTTGKNLFNPENVLVDTFFFADDPTIHETPGTLSVYVECEPNTTYTISKMIGARFVVGYTDVVPAYGLDASGAYRDDIAASITITTGETAKYIVAFVYNNTKDTMTAEEMLASVQIEKGSVATAYEPYTGGIPSPNPQYPQELVSVANDGDVEVEVYGKNLFDKNDAKYVSKLAVESQQMRFYANETRDYRMYYMDAEPNTSYFISKTVGVNLRVCTCPEIPSNNGSITNINANTSENSCVMTTGNEDKYIAFYLLWISEIDSGITYESVIDTLMVAKGGTATDYEPYHKQSLTALTPNGLPGIKVTDASLATYTDADGNMWCADEVDFERGVYVKRVEKIHLTSDMTWKISMSGHKVYTNFGNNTYSIINNSPIACTHGTQGKWSVDSSGTCCFGNGVEAVCAFDVSDFPTVSDLTELLDKETVYIVVPLLTPIETPLTADELASYQALHSNYPVTTILNDSGANMEVKYNADTKLYIDNKFAELQTALVALGGI